MAGLSILAMDSQSARAAAPASAPLEIEIKFAVTGFDTLRQGLPALGAVYVDRCFEVNRVYDDPGRSLKAAGVLLRLRRDRRALLTLKRPPAREVSSVAKVYEEYETEVADFSTAEAILLALGYAPAFAYEKLRETWDLPGGVHVCLDELPFGLFVELEGPEAAILDAARSLGLPRDKALRSTYHQLNREYRQAHGLPAEENFVFPPQRARELAATAC